MKLIIPILLFLSNLFAVGQGTVLFSNLVRSGVDARVTFPDKTPVGDDFTGQLYGGRSGTPIDLLQPLTPTGRFYVHNGSPTGYISALEVKVPGVAPGESATFVMRAYNGLDWDSSTIRGESGLITIPTLGWDFNSASPLHGLRPFHVYPIPEPRPGYLFGGGIAWLLLSRAKLRLRSGG